MAVVLILGLVSTGAAQARVFVARPGAGFGPLAIGSVPPHLPDILCVSGTGVAWMFYAELGVLIRAEADDSPSSALPSERRITLITSAVSATLQPDHYANGCVDSNDQPLLHPVSYHSSVSITYVSDGSVGFGFDVPQVLQAHGAPREIVYRTGSPRVEALVYCGIVFRFDDSGRVAEMTVERTSRQCS